MTKGSRLSYAPLTADRDRLLFYNCKSILELQHATLHSTSTGWMMMGGTLEVSGDSFIESDATVIDEGIWFGNGVSAMYDLCIDNLPNANLEVVSGYVVDKNVGVS